MNRRRVKSRSRGTHRHTHVRPPGSLEMKKSNAMLLKLREIADRRRAPEATKTLGEQSGMHLSSVTPLLQLQRM